LAVALAESRPIGCLMHENKSTPLIHSKLIDHCSAEDNNYNVRQESCRARSHIFDWTMCERS